MYPSEPSSTIEWFEDQSRGLTTKLLIPFFSEIAMGEGGWRGRGDYNGHYPLCPQDKLHTLEIHSTLLNHDTIIITASLYSIKNMDSYFRKRMGSLMKQRILKLWSSLSNNPFLDCFLWVTIPTPQLIINTSHQVSCQSLVGVQRRNMLAFALLIIGSVPRLVYGRHT